MLDQISKEGFAAELNRQLSPLDLGQRLASVAARFPDAVFTSSLGIEDQVISHFIALVKADIRIVTLQTGRLFPETLALIDETQAKLGITIEAFEPEPEALAAYVAKYGANGFYDSVEARHACCHVRKVEPLKKSLAGADGWITGLRREQSQNREDVPFVEWSAEFGVMKFNLLADWSLAQMQQAAREHAIPINPLHARGYPSIGCEPCTRAIKPGEGERAGRWWWENDDTRECGLHVAGEAETDTGDTAIARLSRRAGKENHV